MLAIPPVNKAITATRNLVESFSATLRSPTTNPSINNVKATAVAYPVTNPAINAITRPIIKAHFPISLFTIFHLLLCIIKYFDIFKSSLVKANELNIFDV